jgi:hypothetical protein
MKPLPILHRSACVALLAAACSLNAAAQCTDSTTWEQWAATTVRLNGNDVRGYASHSITGDYRYYWYMYLQSWNYKSGTLIGSYPNGYASPEGTTAWQQYDATLQYWGPGSYSVTEYVSSYSPYCDQWEPPWSNGVSPWYYSNVTTVVRPTRPDYGPAGHTVFYLGPGISNDQAYSNNTALIAGNPNGAPETPQWVFTAGSAFGTLSCTTCSQPLFTATQASASCQDYSVVLNTSYNGFQSDPFYMFINAPNNEEASTCTPNLGCPATWNYTIDWYNGWASFIFYTTDTLCALDGPMTAYDMNESFGSWVPPDYTGATWSPPTPNPWGVPASEWYDELSFACPANNCTPMPVKPTVNCWPDCGTVKVQHATQTLKVGTQNMGHGFAVQQDTQQRFLDHGEHDNIVTPIPQ